MRCRITLIGHYFGHTFIQCKYFVIQLLKIRHLIFQTDLLPRSSDRIIVFLQCFFCQTYRTVFLLAGCNTCSRTCSIQHIVKCHIFHIGITGLIACQHTHPHTKIYIGITAIHRPVFQTDYIGEGMFKKEISIISSFFKGCCQYFLHIFFAHTKMIHCLRKRRLLVSSSQSSLHRRNSQR